MRRYCDFAILIYPIGLELFRYFDVPHEFVGHPLCELVIPAMPAERFRAMLDATDGPLVGLMPGSRVQEVRVIGRQMFEAAAEMHRNIGACVFGLPIAHPELREPVMRHLRTLPVEVKLVERELRYDLICRADLMIVASGTATHECAVAGTPHIMTYRLPALHDFLYGAFTRFRMRFYAFPNIVAGEEVIPELVRGDCRGRRIAEEATALLGDAARLEDMRVRLGEVKERMCRRGTLARAAEICVEVLRRKGQIN
jgi:lipid-A-disaccharide synthase